MKNRLAILCPGQGSQHPGMLDIWKKQPAAVSLLRQWPLLSGTGLPLDSILADHARIFSNRIAQPLVVATTLAAWEVLRPQLPQPALVAGYSVGELAAYAVAGALPASETIRLAAARASLMSACTGNGEPQVMVALSRLHSSAVRDIVAEHGFHVAIETSEDTVIAGGLASHLGALETEVLRQGGHMTALPIGIASHTPYMKEAVQPFAALLSDAPFLDPAIPVLAGISGDKVMRQAQAVNALSEQLTKTIRWKECMDACAEAGITVALELGPGNALTRMLAARHPQIACRSVSDFRTIEGIVSWLRRQHDDR